MRRALIVALLIAAGAPLMFAMSQLPPHGSPETPPYTHVSPYYLEHGAEEAGAENIVTAVIINYRSFDTEHEVIVIFTAMVAVLAVLLLDSPGRQRTAQASSQPVPVSTVVRFVVRVLAPFIALFAIYVILNGHITPGGGFQGGTIIGALVIALSLVMSREDADALLPRKAEHVLQAAAPIAFFAMGLAGVFAWGEYLYFPRNEELRWLTTLMLVVIEIGIGVGGACVLIRIFRAMRAD